MATMGTNSHWDNQMEWGGRKLNGYHGYHERSRREVGLQKDSTTERSHGIALYKNARKCLKQGSLGVVARDGIEPPTPAFSGLRSTN